MDRSREWARSAVRPFDNVPVSLEDLKVALMAPLEERLPVSRNRYGHLVSWLGEAAAAERFVAPHEYCADDISAVTSLVLDEPMCGHELESYDLCFKHLWRVCLGLTGLVSISLGSSATYTEWPDVLLWCDRRLVFKTESRLTSFEQAWVDLACKLCGLDAVCYGPVEWMLGAAAGCECIHFGAFSRRESSEKAVLIRELRLNRAIDPYELLRCSINLLRVAYSWRPIFTDMLVTVAMPYRVFKTVRYGPHHSIQRELFVVDGLVTKQIRPWQLHEERGFATLENVKRAYEDARSPYLMAGRVELVGDTYTVEMESLGLPCSLMTGDQLAQAVHDILQGLKALHGMGLVHRDLKWKNVVFVDKLGLCKLIDFETVWEEGQTPEGDWLKDQVDDNGMFTVLSDLRMVADMMSSSLVPLDSMGHQICSRLRCNEYTAAGAALEDVLQWLALLTNKKRRGELCEYSHF